MKKVLSILVVFTIILGLFTITTLTVSAADTTIQTSASSVEIGNNITVTINMQPSSSMLAVSCVVNYNQDVLKYESGATSGGAGSLQIVLDDESGNGKDKFSATLTFSTIAVGSSNITIKDCIYTYQPAGQLSQEKDFTGASTTVNVTDKILSANADLKKLSLSKGTLSPAFSAGVTSYTASVSNDVTKCSIYATAADTKAKTSGSGVKNLKVGDNTFVVTVTAQSGAQKHYTIVINRAEKSDQTTSDPTTDTEPPANPYEAIIDGNTYIVATDISSVKMLSGFTATMVEYNGTEVAAAVDGENNYTVFYLSAEGTSTLVPYLYNVSENTFVKLNFISQGEYDYILVDFPDDYDFPKGFYATNVKIGENTYDCYGSDGVNMDDFSFFYCYVNGEYGIYRYDSRENVIQRSPEIKLVYVDTKEDKEDNIFSRFSSLSTNSKVIVIAIAVLVIGAAVLLVLFIISMFKKVENLDSEINEEDSEFDEVSVEDGSEDLEEDSFEEE